VNDVRLGVFICDCGDKIASILDLDALERGARDLPGVTTVRRLGYSCSPDGLSVIQAAIAETGSSSLAAPPARWSAASRLLARVLVWTTACLSWRTSARAAPGCTRMSRR
jgi:hypothetical protein